MNILDEKNLKEILYSILFVAGDGIERSFIAEKLDISKKDLDKAIEELKKELSGDKGVHLIEYKDKIQLATNPNYASFISDVLNPIREKSLTRAALETLAIIAYKQPITKLEIEDIRGVNSDYAVQILIDQNMIEVVGRKDAVGKPLLFGTTENFLKRFDIKNISDLPDYDELLERIKTIRSEEDENTQNTLFRNVDDLEFIEELPDYLKGENVQKFEADGNEEIESLNVKQIDKENMAIEKELTALDEDIENIIDESEVSQKETKETKTVNAKKNDSKKGKTNKANEKSSIKVDDTKGHLEDNIDELKNVIPKMIKTEIQNNNIENDIDDKLLGENEDLHNIDNSKDISKDFDLSNLDELMGSDLDDDLVIGSIDVEKLRALFEDDSQEKNIN